MTKPRKPATDPITENLKRASFLIDLITERGAEISLNQTMAGGWRVLVTVPPPSEPIGPLLAGTRGRKKADTLDVTED